MTALDFSVNPNLDLTKLSLSDVSRSGPTFGTFTRSGGFGTGTPSGTMNSYHADSDGYYDLQLSFNNTFTGTTTGGMQAGDTYSFKITGTGVDSTLDASDFAFPSVPGLGNTSKGFYFGAARVVNTISGSDWIAPVPEPSTLLGLITMSLATVGVVIANKARRRAWLPLCR